MFGIGFMSKQRSATDMPDTSLVLFPSPKWSLGSGPEELRLCSGIPERPSCAKPPQKAPHISIFKRAQALTPYIIVSTLTLNSKPAQNEPQTRKLKPKPKLEKLWQTHYGTRSKVSECRQLASLHALGLLSTTGCIKTREGCSSELQRKSCLRFLEFQTRRRAQHTSGNPSVADF